MRAEKAPAGFHVPLTIGRSYSDLLVHGKEQQLHLFRAIMTRPARLQVLAMMALTDPKQPEDAQWAKIADILEVMEYERKERRTDGKMAFHPEDYQKIEEVAMILRRKQVSLYIREPTGRTADGRRKYRAGIVDINVLQEFGFGYVDEDGQEIDLDHVPETQLIKYEAVDGGSPIWAIPLLNGKGQIVRKKNGTPRRRPASRVIWRWSSRLIELMKKRGGSWVFFRNALNILKRYLSKPATFELIYWILFHKDGQIEIGHDKLVLHLGIKSKDKKRVQSVIDQAFEDALHEGIIDTLPTTREAGYYQPTKKTGRPRRVGKVYQFTKSQRWSVKVTLARQESSQ